MTRGCDAPPAAHRIGSPSAVSLIEQNAAAARIAKEAVLHQSWTKLAIFRRLSTGVMTQRSNDYSIGWRPNWRIYRCAGDLDVTFRSLLHSETAVVGSLGILTVLDVLADRRTAALCARPHPHRRHEWLTVDPVAPSTLRCGPSVQGDAAAWDGVELRGHAARKTDVQAVERMQHARGEETGYEVSSLGTGGEVRSVERVRPHHADLAGGLSARPCLQALPVDLVLEKDVPVTLRDGVTIYVDVLRPVGPERVPVIVAWSPYGKGEGSAPAAMGVFGLVGLDNGIVSGLHKFEGPDPAYWCAQGYAICDPDVRGVSDSEGDSVSWDRQEGRDCHDLIEWLAVQEWCTGKVAMSGTSYLAVAQWFTAAERPPHLAAINPWQGISDVYRDLVVRGGMPDTGFARQLQDNSYWGKNRREDVVAEAQRYPLVNDLWENKIPRVDRIDVPAYVVASHSNTLHTAGTFRAWRRIGSAQKWLRIHNTQEWPDYYDEANREDLRRFFDHFLKDEDNGWEQTPRVRYAVLDLEGGDVVDVPADQFPPVGIAYTKYYLDGPARTLDTQAPAEAVTVAYEAQTNPTLASFIVRFAEKTTMVGYPKVRLWVEARGADDMDLFAFVEKLDVHGTPLWQFTVPNHGAQIHDVTERGASILRYKGSEGRLRVSMRNLDQTLSTDEVPAHSFDRVEKLDVGEVVDVEIALLPIGLAFHPGEQLRLIISAQNLFGPWMPGLRGYTPQNSGQHIVHTGGPRASYLQLPIAC